MYKCIFRPFLTVIQKNYPKPYFLDNFFEQFLWISIIDGLSYRIWKISSKSLSKFQKFKFLTAWTEHLFHIQEKAWRDALTLLLTASVKTPLKVSGLQTTGQYDQPRHLFNFRPVLIESCLLLRIQYFFRWRSSSISFLRRRAFERLGRFRWWWRRSRRRFRNLLRQSFCRHHFAEGNCSIYIECSI